MQLRGALELLELLLMFKAGWYILVLVGTLCVVGVASAETGNDRVKVSALADVSSIQAGKPFWMGFNFAIKPGFHIYWKNPGDSGLATEIKLNLPEGFTAGELMFPVPRRLKLPGDIINYAYEDNVMLLTQITPPKNLAAGAKVAISARVNWLVCKDDCLPGSSNVSLDLSVADVAVPANEELFKSWGGRLPLKADPTDVASIWCGRAIYRGGCRGTVRINWKILPNEIQYLPGPLKSGDTTDVKVNTTGQSTLITFDVKNLAEGEPVSGLVTFTTPSVEQIGLDVSIPGDSATTKH